MRIYTLKVVKNCDRCGKLIEEWEAPVDTSQIQIQELCQECDNVQMNLHRIKEDPNLETIMADKKLLADFIKYIKDKKPDTRGVLGDCLDCQGQ